MSTFREHVREAIRIKGSQAKLAAAMGCSQQQISYLLHSANIISAEMAVAIEKATAGEIPRQRIRPDLYQVAAKRSHKLAVSP